MFERDFLYFHLCPLHLVLSLSSIGKSTVLSYLPSSPLLQSGTHTHEIFSKLSHLHAKHSQCSQYISSISIGSLLDMLQRVLICLERQLKKESLISEKNDKNTDF